MECSRFNNYLKENEGREIAINADLKKHIGECRECKNCFLLVKILNSQKGVLKKVPETILFNIRQKIDAREKVRENSALSAV